MRRFLYMCAAAAVAGGGAGCDPGFETASIVIDLRALAVRADPPEVVLDIDPMDPDSFDQLSIPPVRITGLFADPGTVRRLEWIMTACPPTQSLRCDDPEAPYIAVDFGTIQDPEGTFGSEQISAELTATPIILQESLRLDDAALLGGIGVQVELVIYPEGDDDLSEAIYASKKVLYSPRIPETRVANSNPPAASLFVDGGPLGGQRCGEGQTFHVTPGQVVVIDLVEAEGARETYQLPTFDGEVRTITENLRYSWYATAGSFSAETTGGPLDPFGNVPPLYSEWTAPEDEGNVRFWLVERDERGGASWLERCFEVAAPVGP